MDADKISELINTHRRKIKLTLTGAPAPIVIDHEWLNVEEIIKAFADELEAEAKFAHLDVEQDEFDREAFETTARGTQPEPKSPVVQPFKSGLILPGGPNGH